MADHFAYRSGSKIRLRASQEWGKAERRTQTGRLLTLGPTWPTHFRANTLLQFSVRTEAPDFWTNNCGARDARAQPSALADLGQAAGRHH